MLTKFLSYFPSRQGEQSLKDLMNVLSCRGINFDFKKIKDETGEYYFAESTNLYNKSIVAAGKNLAELDKNIKDAIFSIYRVPAHYCRYDLIKSPDIISAGEKIQFKYATA